MSPHKAAKAERRGTHMTEAELLVVYDEAGESIAAALQHLMHRAEREQRCTGCFARAMASALTQQAAWFGALAAEQTTDPEGAAAWLATGFAEALRLAMQTATATGGSCGVH